MYAHACLKAIRFDRRDSFFMFYVNNDENPLVSFHSIFSLLPTHVDVITEIRTRQKYTSLSLPGARR